MLNIVFVGNFNVDYSSETHHKKSLESLGHKVIPLQEGVATSEDILNNAINSDLLVFVHTHGWVTPGNMSISNVFSILQENGIPTMTYHLDLWFGLKREKDLEQDDFYRSIGHFFTVDKLMADWFNDNTTVKGHYLQAGVFYDECRIADMPKEIDVLFVGSKGYHPEWPYRPQLINWLSENYRGFRHWGGDGAGTVRGRELNRLYGYSKVVVGDTLCLNYNYPYYWSDRVYETLGRGGFIIHPYIQGMEEHFEDGKHLVFYEYGDFKQLKTLIDYYLEHDTEREKIRQQGHEHIKLNHTYKNRWQHILKELKIND